MRLLGQFKTVYFLLLLQKDFTRTKSTKSTKIQPNKSIKSIKAQKTQMSD